MSRSRDQGERPGEPLRHTPVEGGLPPAPANAQTSGTVARAAVPPPEDAPRFRTFDEVYEELESFVYVTALRLLQGDKSGAEDVCQGVWLRFHRRIRANGAVPDPVVPVLVGLVDDQVRNHLRSQRRRRIAGEPDENAPPSSRPDPELLLAAARERATREQEVRWILSQMDERAARVLQLGHLEGVSVKGIAAMVGRSVGTVSKDLCRARARFKELYLRLRRKK
jgi:RNA polymerase sigma factor (sigma-70 family)